MYSIKIFKHHIRLLRYLLLKGKYYGNNNITLQFKKNTSFNYDKNSINNIGEVIFVCDGLKIHGGLADRLKGLLTTYSDTKRIKKKFKIFWISPFNLEDFLIPNKINWIIKRESIFYNYKYSFPLILDISLNHFKNILKKYLFRSCLRDKRNILVYSNLMHEKKNVAVLFHELFKPSLYLQGNIDYQLKKIESPYYSYTFRFGNSFGDFKDIIGTKLSENKKKNLLEENIRELKKLLQDLPPSFKALITSDSLYFLRKVKTIDPRIYVIDKELMHIDYFDKEIINKEIWLKTFLDFYLIMKAEKIIQVKSNVMYNSSFPQFISILGSKPYYLHEF